MKSDQATVRQRVEEILQLRQLGAEFVDIRQHASQSNPPWNVSDRQLWRYIEASDALLERTLEKDRKKLLNRHISARRALYARAMSTSDHKTALAVLKDEADLLHLYDVMPDGQAPGDPSPMGTADVVKVLAARLRQIEAAELPASEKARLTATLSDALLRAIQGADLEERIRALEEQLLSRQAHHRNGSFA